MNGRLATLAITLLVAACATAPRPRLPTPGAAPPSDRLAPPATEIQPTIVANALRMLGQPYRYGGAAPGGFDCSGLVAYAAAGAGVKVPRTAREQLDSLTPIPRAAARAGDLVFMHLRRKELHVGIVVDQGRFVHAPSTGGVVRIDSLTAKPYASGFLAARRILGSRVSPAPGTARQSSATSGAIHLLARH